ncbi:hypothetical protein CFC21_012428 [Triticum aestivum]|uniref:AP2/ERF domain-containing protein n=2 Tax=Triticum aestivum TaxID=4565 RepID=A0A3B5ZWB1_WHEAT|nr:hypothetical protein CFC21_012428 [Triticum aestivum]
MYFASLGDANIHHQPRGDVKWPPTARTAFGPSPPNAACPPYPAAGRSGLPTTAAAGSVAFPPPHVSKSPYLKPPPPDSELLRCRRCPAATRFAASPPCHRRFEASPPRRLPIRSFSAPPLPIQIRTRAAAMPPKRVSKSRTGYFGVREKPSGNFGAEFLRDGYRYWLDTFKYLEVAARAYDVAAWCFGRSRHEMNFPDIETWEDVEFIGSKNLKIRQTDGEEEEEEE